MPMPITKESYQDLKEYWDFQRKIQYNKEKKQWFKRGGFGAQNKRQKT